MRRLKHERRFYIPAGAAKVTAKTAAAEFYLYETNGKPYAVAFVGKAQKPTWHHSFRSEASRAAHIQRTIDGCVSSGRLRADAKAARRTPRKLEVGHILDSQWGYDQTNVDFFEVTALVGDTMVELRPIAEHREQTGHMQGRTMPKAGEYTGPAFRRRVSHGTSVTIDNVRHASLWNCRPQTYTEYA